MLGSSSSGAAAAIMADQAFAFLILSKPGIGFNGLPLTQTMSLSTVTVAEHEEISARLFSRLNASLRDSTSWKAARTLCTAAVPLLPRGLRTGWTPPRSPPKQLQPQHIPISTSLDLFLRCQRRQV